jgi:hypothetical protein
MSEGAIMGLIVMVGLLIRLFRLAGIPAEMWGDVIGHYYLATKILEGHLFLDYEFGGDGPLFSYLAAGVAEIGGLSFESLKLTGALVGAALVPAVYFYVRTLFDSRTTGYVAAILTAVSFWPVVISRQAKPYILVPVLVALALTFALKRKPVLAGVVVGIGMYAQAAFWGAPFLFLLMPLALPFAALVALPLIISFVQSPDTILGSQSYLGSKLDVVSTPGARVVGLLENFKNNALSFNVSGDQTFRQNIAGHPHLDVVTGVLFLAGLILAVIHTVRTRDRRMLFWFLLPFLVLQIPMLTDQVASDSPNTGRLACLIPVTMAAAAYGFQWLVAKLCALLSGRVPDSRKVAGAAGGAVLAVIAVINLNNYFNVYPHGLPNNNTPFDLAIAQNMNRSALGTTLILIGGGWGQFGQPEPEAVWFRTTAGHAPVLVNSPRAAVHTLRALHQGTPVIMYSNPDLPMPAHLPLKGVKRSLVTANGWRVAQVTAGRVAASQSR